MKKLLLVPITALIMLSACKTTVPVTMAFPEAPPEITTPCEDLALLADNAKLSDLMATVTANYVKYHTCKAHDQGWIDWYNQQKAIFDAATKGATSTK